MNNQQNNQKKIKNPVTKKDSFWKKYFIGIGVVILLVLLASLGEGKIEGSVIGNSYIGRTNVSINANESIMFGQGSKYDYILIHVWKVIKKHPNLNNVDINFIIKGDDGYGNTKTSNWCHLIFSQDELNELGLYSDLSKMSWSEKSNLLDKVGMWKLKDVKGDLSKDVFLK